MNQISPRVFEAISMRSCLVLFEGEYSGIIEPQTHFIPLKRDGSNLEEVVSLVNDDEYIDSMTDRAYKDIILSGNNSYQAFVKKVDSEVQKAFKKKNARDGKPIPGIINEGELPKSQITDEPIKSPPVKIRIWPVQMMLQILEAIFKRIKKVIPRKLISLFDGFKKDS